MHGYLSDLKTPKEQPSTQYTYDQATKVHIGLAGQIFRLRQDRSGAKSSDELHPYMSSCTSAGHAARGAKSMSLPK